MRNSVPTEIDPRVEVTKIGAEVTPVALIVMVPACTCEATNVIPANMDTIDLFMRFSLFLWIDGRW